MKTIEAYTVVIKEGRETTDKMYFLLEGKAGVYANYGIRGEKKLYELKAGDFFDEMKLFVGKDRVDSVISLSELKVFELTKDNAAEFFAGYPKETYKLIKTLCERIEELSEKPAPEPAPPPAPAPAPPAPPPPAPAPAPAPAPPPPVPAPAPAPPPAPAPALSVFPAGHNKYALPEYDFKKDLIRDEKYKCPLCGRGFEFPIMRTVVIRTLSTDFDLRKHYDGVVGAHYMAVTCPDCLFSAVADRFADAGKANRAELTKEIGKYKSGLNISSDAMDADTIFTRLYLALICAPFCYDNFETLTARIWINISWMYKDCGDEKMEKYATLQALQTYLKVYTNIKLDKKTEQAVCQIIGELSFRTGDYANAKKFFFAVKTNEEGSPALVKLADDRLIDIKEGGFE